MARVLVPLHTALPLAAGWRSVNSRFGDFGHGDDWPRFETAWTSFASVSIDEGLDGVRVTAEMPDLDRDDVKVEVDGGLLVVSWSTTEAKEEGGRDWHRRARAAGVFERIMSMPGDVDAASAAAAMRDGVLTIDVPRTRALARVSAPNDFRARSHRATPQPPTCSDEPRPQAPSRPTSPACSSF